MILVILLANDGPLSFMSNLFAFSDSKPPDNRGSIIRKGNCIAFLTPGQEWYCYQCCMRRRRWQRRGGKIGFGLFLDDKQQTAWPEGVSWDLGHGLDTVFVPYKIY